MRKLHPLLSALCCPPLLSLRRSVASSLRRSPCSLLSAVCYLLFCIPAHAADQPQWGRPHTRNMVSDEIKLPASFDLATGKNVKWSAPLGTETYATPVIAAGRVYIGTNNEHPRDERHQGDRGILLCLDEKDGRLLWQLVVPKLEGDKYYDWPRAGLCSPPTIEGDRIYAITNRGEVVCLDPQGQANGNDGPYTDESRHHTPRDAAAPIPLASTDADILWLYDIVNQSGTYPHDSAHCSILLHGDYLYINTSNAVDNTHRRIRRPDAPSLIVLDRRTGRLVAQDTERVGPRIFHSTWSSPALGHIAGKPIIFFCGGDGVVYAFEALTQAPPPGQILSLKRIWRYDPDPTAPKENVHNWTGNRTESPSNIKSMPTFDAGRLYVTVGGDFWWGKNRGWLKCVDAGKGTEIWSHEMKRTCTTPAVHQGFVLAGDTDGVLHCVDAATGQPLWSHKLRGPLWASPLVADGRIYAASRRGEVAIFAASREKTLLFTTDLDTTISSSLTAANQALYLATHTHLYALRCQE